MPEIAEETLQAWVQLADYTDSHGSLDARVALDAAIAEIRRQRELLAERDGQIGALVAGLMKMKSAWWEARHSSFVNQDAMGLALVATDNLLANLPAATQARDKRLRAEGAAEALERVAQYLRDSVNKAEVPKGDIGVAAERLTMARIAVNCAAEAARQREEAGR